jgi:hypothetical protein
MIDVSGVADDDGFHAEISIGKAVVGLKPVGGR